MNQKQVKKKKAEAIGFNPSPASSASSSSSEIKADQTFDKTFEFSVHDDEKNIEDVFREFVFKQAHLFIKHDLTYGICYFAQTKIGEIKLSVQAAPIGISFEDLHIELSSEEIELFLAERVKLQKQFLKTF